MATPSVGTVWDSIDIIGEEMMYTISDSIGSATYEVDGVVYTLGVIALGDYTMMTFTVKIP